MINFFSLNLLVMATKSDADTVDRSGRTVCSVEAVECQICYLNSVFVGFHMRRSFRVIPRI